MFLKLTFSLLLLVTCSPYGKKETPPPSLNEMEQQVVQLVNKYRRSKGLSPLRTDPAMQQEAERHSLNMARGRIPLSHNGFEGRIRNVREKTGVKGRSGENVAEGYKTAREVVDAWIRSPGHRKHMLGAFDLTGVGIVRSRNGNLYFTQLFIAVKYNSK
ncbi:CAP domain-containing protein [Anseongella ginsenosidimutans]|nr:CAP domain-containing protein [Anseongella ginsenosidimutans]